MTLAFPLSEWLDPGSRPVPTQSDRWAEFFMICLFGIPSLGVAWWLIHCRIIAQPSGITLVGFSSSSFHPWSEIQDYELRVPKSSQSQAISSPVSAEKMGTSNAYLKIGGQWRSLAQLLKLYSHYEELLQTISREAKWSRSREWKQGVLREDGDWPKTFVYHATPRWQLVIFPALGILGAGVATLWSRNGAAFLNLSLYLGLHLLLWRGRQAPVDFLGQKITVTKEGVQHLANGSEIFIPWSEIKSYHLEVIPGHVPPKLCVVQSMDKRIEFLTAIGNASGLRGLIQNLSTNATTKKWAYLHGADEDVIGGAVSLWPSGYPGAGQKIHHHQTRAARAMLALGFFVVGILMLPFLFRLTGYDSRAVSTEGIVMNALVVLLAGQLLTVGYWFFFILAFSAMKQGCGTSRPGEKRVCDGMTLRKWKTTETG